MRSIVLWFSLIILVQAGSLVKDPKVLLLTGIPSTGTQTLKSQLTTLKLPFDTISVPSTGYNAAITLTNGDQGLYSAIIFPDGLCSVLDESMGMYVSALNESQWAQINNYEREFKIKRVLFNIYPSVNQSTQLVNQTKPGCCAKDVEQTFKWDPNAFNSINGTKIDVNAPLSSVGMYHYPANIINGNARPILYAEPLAPSYPDTSVVGLILNYPTERQELVFHTSIGDWSMTSQTLARYALYWAYKETSTPLPTAEEPVTVPTDPSASSASSVYHSLLLTIILLFLF